jgi:hypothetical protein
MYRIAHARHPEWAEAEYAGLVLFNRPGVMSISVHPDLSAIIAEVTPTEILTLRPFMGRPWRVSLQSIKIPMTTTQPEDV